LLEKNLKALEIKNPLLANKIKLHEIKNITAFSTQTGSYNIAYNEIALHNNIDPIKEAEELFKMNKKDDSANNIFIVYGLGLGYLFKRTHVSSNAKIILLEPLLDVLTFTLTYVDFSEELKDNRVFICTSLDEAMEILKQKYLIGDKLDVLFLPSYLKINSELIENLSKSLIEFIESKNMDQGTIITMSELWGQKAINNINYVQKALPVELFKGKFKNLPILIASAGPSLEENLELIKQNRDKFVLITINTALRALLNHNIIPDFCVVSEIWHIDVQFENLPNLDKIKYIFIPRTQSYCWGLSNYNNLLYLTEIDGFSQWYNKLLDNKYTLWPSAGTVSILAFYISTLVFQSKKIILVGQDLALIDNKPYASSVVKEDESIEIQNGFLVFKSRYLENEYHTVHFKLVEITNYLGEKLYTRKDYYQYISQYESIIKNEIPKDIEIINTSLKGANIKGMTYKSLAEIIKEYPVLKEDINNIFNSIVNEHQVDIIENAAILSNKLKIIDNKVQEHLQNCFDLIKLNNDITSVYKDRSNLNKVIELINLYQGKKAALFNFIKTEELYFYMLQKHFIEYTNKFIKPTGNSLNDFENQISNIIIEKDLLEAIKNVFSYYLEHHNA